MSPADGALSGRQPKAVQSALQVLEAVALAGTGVTAKDIAEHLSMPSATTYRLLNLLVADGYIVRLPDLSGFALGPRMGLLIDAAVSPTVCTKARETLAEKRDADTLLALTPAALTDRTITSKSALAEQLAEIRECGYAAQTGELRADSACVAVPVRSATATLVAAVAMSGRAEQEQLLRKQVPALQDCATQLAPLLA